MKKLFLSSEKLLLLRKFGQNNKIAFSLHFCDYKKILNHFFLQKCKFLIIFMMRYLMSVILSLLSAVLTVYTILCFINIIMSWLPGVKFTAFGKFISSVTDPYLTFFSKWRFLTIGHIDFSPIISIGLLSLASSILGGIQSTGRIYFGGILATIIYMLWNIVSSILSIFLLFVIIRWIMILVSKKNFPY